MNLRYGICNLSIFRRALAFPDNSRVLRNSIVSTKLKAKLVEKSVTVFPSHIVCFTCVSPLSLSLLMVRISLQILNRESHSPIITFCMNRESISMINGKRSWVRQYATPSLIVVSFCSNADSILNDFSICIHKISTFIFYAKGDWVWS